MRYATGSFSFNKLRVNASDEGVHELATAIATLQNEPVRQIVTVVTRQII